MRFKFIADTRIVISVPDDVIMEVERERGYAVIVPEGRLSMILDYNLWKKEDEQIIKEDEPSENIGQLDLGENELQGIPGRDYIPVAWVDACEAYGKWKIVRTNKEDEKRLK